MGRVSPPHLLTLLIICLTLSGCGYRWGADSEILHDRTLSVPFIEGDCEGELTAEVIRELIATGEVEYSHHCGELTLEVRLIDLREENIGFRYDREGAGQLTNTVIPSEARLTALAEVTVTKSVNGVIMIGPDLVTASIEYDHDYYSNQGGVNLFSLGQLNDIDLAKQAARRPLYRALGRAIAQHVIHSW
jgi:hypothetical protein